MATVWRLTPPQYAHDLTGEGSSMTGGRWNSPGRLMLYTSSHLSLSVLEVFVHIAPDLRDDLPDLTAVCLVVPDDAGVRTVSDAQFREFMANAALLAACQAFGDTWLAAGVDLILAAPSVIVPEELNVMLNPAHPRMHEVAIVSARRFRFDPRLVRGG